MRKVFAFVVALVLSVSVSAGAATISFGSHDSANGNGLGNIIIGTSQGSDRGSALALVPNDAWYGPLEGTDWISLWNSGDPNQSDYVQVPNGTIVNFAQMFTIPEEFTVRTATLWFLADDTGMGWLNGYKLFEMNFSQGVHCASGVPGCLASTMFVGNINPRLFRGGSNQMTFTFEQLYGSSFGVDWRLDLSDDVPPDPVPEPATMSLLGIGLLGVAGTVRRRLSK